MNFRFSLTLFPLPPLFSAPPPIRPPIPHGNAHDGGQESIHKVRQALRREHQNSTQQNLVRVAENLELTRELNSARRENARLATEVTRLEARMKVHTLVLCILAYTYRCFTGATEFIICAARGENHLLENHVLLPCIGTYLDGHVTPLLRRIFECLSRVIVHVDGSGRGRNEMAVVSRRCLLPCPCFSTR